MAEKAPMNLSYINLPHVWAVIYYEGIRNQHLLFSDLDVAAFESNADGRPTTRELTDIDSHFLNVLSLSTISEMRTYISRLTLESRRAAFLIYKCLLGFQRDILRTSLN